MPRPVFLRNLTHRVLWTVTLAGTVAFIVYWILLREPVAEWRVLVLGLLLSIALGWWPLVSAIIGVVLATLSWFFTPSEFDRLQIVQEILVFMALGQGWGLLLRGLLKPLRDEHVLASSPEPSRHEKAPLQQDFRAPETRQAPASSPSLMARPVARPPADSTPSAAPQIPAVAAPLFEPSPAAGSALPLLNTPSAATPPPQRHLSASAPQQAAPGGRDLFNSLPIQEAPPTVIVPQAAPFMTQEVDLGDFRSFVASQQQNASVNSDVLPVNRVSGRSLDVRSSQIPAPASQASDQSSGAPSVLDEPSSVLVSEAGLRRSQALARTETVPGAPFEAILEWYNQFSWAPWVPEELEKRYYRQGQKVGWDVLALQDLVRAWKVWQAGAHQSPVHPGFTSLHDLEGFLRCEMLGFLRSRGFPDLNLLSREEHSDAWMAVYRETRGRARGGMPVMRPMPDNLLAFDPEHSLSGRPDALVEVAGECDVVAFITPMSAGEPMTWTGIYAEAQRQLAIRLGVVVTDSPIVVTLRMPIWDERRQPRLHEIPDHVTEGRRLGFALERFRKIQEGSQTPRAQTHPTVCNGCGLRHFCASYAGTRSRLNLAEPPPLLQKFLL